MTATATASALSLPTAQEIADRLAAAIDPSGALKYRGLRRWVLALLHGAKTRNKVWTTDAIQAKLFDSGNNPKFATDWPQVQRALSELSGPACEVYSNVPTMPDGFGPLIESVNGAWQTTARFRQAFPGQSAQELPMETGPCLHFYYEIVVGGYTTPDDVTKRTETSKGETIKKEEARIFATSCTVTKGSGSPYLQGVSMDRILNDFRPVPGGAQLAPGKFEPRGYHLVGINNLEVNGKEFKFTPQERMVLNAIELARQEEEARKSK